MRAGTQVPQELTAILMSDPKRAWDSHEHQAECKPTTCSHRSYSKSCIWLH